MVVRKARIVQIVYKHDKYISVNVRLNRIWDIEISLILKKKFHPLPSHFVIVQYNNKKCTQRAQTSADPEDPDFGLWTPGSEA